MSTEAHNSGVIDAHDIDELNYSVFPWQLDMRQMSPGKLHAHIGYVEVNGMLLNREYWSQSISAIGTTPTGYLALSGPCTERLFKWHGTEIDTQHLIYGFDAGDADFLTPVDADHWVILVPKDLIISHLGEESAANLLRNQDVLRCASRQRRQIITLVDRSLGKLPEDSKAQLDDQTREAISSELLDIITEILLLNDTSQKHSTPKKRYLACRKAITHAMKLSTPIRVLDLAAVAGVSQRVLELGFQEALGMSPQKFLRWNRLNQLHRNLRNARAANTTVTDICNHWGFHELGRTAVEYKQLFDESPSSTLRRDSTPYGMRLVDALHKTKQKQ
jgi:AraC family ethanolamine operon transcriptional activator